VEQAWQYLDERFGVTHDAALFDTLTLKEKAGDIWLMPADHATEMAVKTYGIRFIRVQDIGLKPTTYALQLLDNTISRNIVDITDTQCEELLDGELVPVEHLNGEPGSPGYVAVRYRGRVLGCGLYKNGTVSSRIAKGRAQELRDAL
jgi:NOL1/NOP2/fmu family ribosome biogenesis protein